DIAPKNTDTNNFEVSFQRKLTHTSRVIKSLSKHSAPKAIAFSQSKVVIRRRRDSKFLFDNANFGSKSFDIAFVALPLTTIVEACHVLRPCSCTYFVYDATITKSEEV